MILNPVGLRINPHIRQSKDLLVKWCYQIQGGFNMKTIFENNGGTYTQVGDYLLPNLSLPAEENETNIGVWAMRHKRYLKQNYKVRYYNLLTSGKLDSYLADIE